MAESERRPEVDVLRAVALLGIVVVNVAVYRTGVGPSLAAGGGRVGGLSDGLTTALSALAEGRFYPLFSFLFGWGLAVQDARSRVRGRSVVGPWLRRCAVLLLFGVAHGVLLFEGDILTTYALLGGLLLLARPLRPVWLAALGTALVVLQALFAAGLEALATWAYDAPGDRATLLVDTHREWRTTADLFARGSFAEVARHRAGELALDLPLGLLSVGGTVLGMMLLGMAAARAGWVDPRRWPGWLRAGAVPLWLVGLLLSWPAATALGDAAVLPPSPGAAFAGRAAYSLLGPLMALLWAAVVLRAGATSAGGRVARVLAPAGRMSMTVYLTQSLVASLLFCGYGLGLGERVGIGAAVAIMAGVWAVQVVLAALWFRAFAFGPLEGLTRAVAYWRWPAWRRPG